MGARPIGGNELRVPGLYAKVRAKELKLALSPDPRLYGLDAAEREHDAATAPTYSPTVLGAVEELLAYKPVKFPRWWLGGRMVPEAHGWAPYADRRHEWFAVGPDDVVTPA